MKIENLTNFKAGWIVGDFEPALVRSKDFEFGIKFFKSGDSEPIHYQLTATEITVVISGEGRIGEHLFSAGEIITLEPLESAGFEAITDCQLAVIKFPSLPNDKYLGEP